MNVRFYLDPETGDPPIYNHGVSEDEVEDVLRAPGEDRPGREGLEWPPVRPVLEDTYGSSTLQIRSQIVSL
jgi:hypothetical protein